MASATQDHFFHMSVSPACSETGDVSLGATGSIELCYSRSS